MPKADYLKLSVLIEFAHSQLNGCADDHQHIARGKQDVSTLGNRYSGEQTRMPRRAARGRRSR
jgi:hypothetical protein